MKNKVFIIAEIGVNHNGSLTLAKKMILEAAKAGVDAAKFQTFKASNLVTKNASKAKYQTKNTGNNEKQFEMLKKLELSFNDFKTLKHIAKKNKVEFMSSPFDLESINDLIKLNVKTFKIPSGEITNLPYLRKIGSLKKKVILSTGMCTINDITSAINVLTKAGLKKSNLTILHCNTEYPTPFKDVNLNAMLTLKNKFKVNVGYSDHTLGFEVPIAAVALGATVIEKHVTLDKKMVGPDHKASLDFKELTQMVKAIRNIENSLGSSVKKPSLSEKKNIKIARKSIVAASFISKGNTFNENNITIKRPGSGISPMLWDKVIGKKAHKNFKEDELICLS